MANFDFMEEIPLNMFILIHFFIRPITLFWFFKEQACLDEILGQSSSRTRTFYCKNDVVLAKFELKAQYIMF